MLWVRSPGVSIQPGLDGVDADVLGGKFESPGGGHVVDGGLGSVVGGGVGVGAESVDGADVDDGSAALRGHEAAASWLQ